MFFICRLQQALFPLNLPLSVQPHPHCRFLVQQNKPGNQFPAFLVLVLASSVPAAIFICPELFFTNRVIRIFLCHNQSFYSSAHYQSSAPWQSMEFSEYENIEIFNKTQRFGINKYNQILRQCRFRCYLNADHSYQYSVFEKQAKRYEPYSNQSCKDHFRIIFSCLFFVSEIIYLKDSLFSEELISSVIISAVPCIFWVKSSFIP